MVSPEQAIGWVHASDNFLGIDPATAAEAKDIHITITGLTDAIYRVTFTDTTTGLPLQRVDQRSRNGQLDLALPPFRRDIAFKLATITP